MIGPAPRKGASRVADIRLDVLEALEWGDCKPSRWPNAWR